MQVIYDYSHKKVADYLLTGCKALIDFPHGLGDDVMFMPLLVKMRELYPQSEIDVRWADGRTDVFPQPKQTAYYDYVFKMAFRETPDEARFRAYSKPECCCIKELGIPFDLSMDFTWQPPKFDSPFIGVSFMCNSNSHNNIPYSVAKQVWTAIQERGMIPIEIYFHHQQFNTKNKPYDFINCSTRGVKPSVEAFTATLQSCRGFVGVNSGTLCMTSAMYPDRVLHLYNRHHFTFYRKRPVNFIVADGCSQFNFAELCRWIDCIKTNQRYAMPNSDPKNPIGFVS